MKTAGPKTRVRRNRWLSQTARTQRVFEWIAGGWSVRRATVELSKEPGVPKNFGESRVFAWLLEPARLDRYRQARAVAVERMMDELLSLADEAAADGSADRLRAAKLQMDIRRWLAARWMPQWYGEKSKSATEPSGSSLEEVLKRLAEDANGNPAPHHQPENV